MHSVSSVTHFGCMGLVQNCWEPVLHCIVGECEIAMRPGMRESK